MKAIAPLLILACLVVMPVEGRADLVVTLGGVSGVETNLDVTIEGSGILGADTYYLNVYSFPESEAKGGARHSDTHLFTATGSAENNIGNIVSSLYNYYGVLLSAPITLSNVTASTAAQVEYLLFDYDAPVGEDADQDDFQLVFFAPKLFIKAGDEWAISGTSTIALAKGNASVFNLGTYSYTDTAIGEVTLVIQEEYAVIPEPFTGFSFVIGGLLLMLFRKKVLGGNQS